MSDQPEGTFEPAGGKLGQQLFLNPSETAEPELRFFVEIAFKPFEWDDESHSPLLRVDNLVVSAKSWRDLAEQIFEFPYSPKPGSVEGAILMFGEHNPADVTRLEFGELLEGKIRCRFETEVDFEIEADRDDLEQMEMKFDLPLTIEPLRISTSLEKQCQGDPEAIRQRIASSVDLSAYGEIEKAAGGFILPVG